MSFNILFNLIYYHFIYKNIEYFTFGGYNVFKISCVFLTYSTSQLGRATFQ